MVGGFGSECPGERHVRPEEGAERVVHRFGGFRLREDDDAQVHGPHPGARPSAAAAAAAHFLRRRRFGVDGLLPSRRQGRLFSWRVLHFFFTFSSSSSSNNS